MSIVKIAIANKDRKVGAMVKALAVETSGFQSVKGATKDFLATHGFYQFRFPSNVKADEFRDSVRRYIPEIHAKIAL